MLSGIGDSAELGTLGIDTIINMPDVGKHMQDHPWVPLPWLVNTTNTLDSINRNKTLFDDDFRLYQQTGQGPIANNPGANHIGWFRLPENSSILEEFGDSTSGKLSPHFELTFGVFNSVSPNRLSF